MRKFYTDLSSVSNNDPQFEKVVKLASRCYNDIDNLWAPALYLAKKTRASGAGRKQKDPEIREKFFSWFIDASETLKQLLPLRLFKLKAQQQHSDWLTQNPVPLPDLLKFGNTLIQGWEEEYGVSLRKPNKWYSIKKEDSVEPLTDYLKNVLQISCFFINNGDHMPLNQKESSQQKTLTFNG